MEKILVKWPRTFPWSDTTASREVRPRYMIRHKGIMTMQTPFFLNDRMDLELAFDGKSREEGRSPWSKQPIPARFQSLHARFTNGRK